MAWSFKNLFRTDVRTSSFKNNTVKLQTNSDVLFNIGRDLGEIKNSLSNVDKQFKDINKTLREHHKRISVLEIKINKE